MKQVNGTPVETKSERIEVRITRRQKEFLQQAAELSGLSLSDFIIITSTQRAAEGTVREHTVLTLSAQDSAAFVEALHHPDAPNAALRESWARYDTHTHQAKEMTNGTGLYSSSWIRPASGVAGMTALAKICSSVIGVRFSTWPSGDGVIGPARGS